MGDRERQRCVIDKLWIAILHFPNSQICWIQNTNKHKLLSTLTNLGGWTNATFVPILASIKNWFNIQQKFTLSWQRSFCSRYCKSGWIYSADQNISPVELWIYPLDQNISPVELRIYSIDLELIFTPARPGLEECPQRCSCRSSNTSENIRSSANVQARNESQKR